MWNNWMEKAKTMAADIDQQLNEAVGVDGESNHVSTAGTAPSKQSEASPFSDLLSGRLSSAVGAAAAAGGGTSLAVSKGTGVNNNIANAQDHDDVWNDDFDFEDDDDNANDGNAAKEDENKPIIQEQQQISQVGVVATQSTIPSTTTRFVDSALESSSDPPTESSGQEEVLPIPSQPTTEREIMTTEDIIATKTETLSVMENVESVDPPQNVPNIMSANNIDESSNQQVQTTTSAPDDTPAEAGWDDDNALDDLDGSNNREEDDEANDCTTAPDDAISPPKPAQAFKAASKLMFSSFGGAKEVKSSESSFGSNTSALPARSGTRIFSNLAHQAEGGVSSLLHAAAHLTLTDDVENDRGKNMEEKDETDDIATQNTSPAAKSAMLGFFSTAGKVLNVATHSSNVSSLKPLSDTHDFTESKQLIEHGESDIAHRDDPVSDTSSSQLPTTSLRRETTAADSAQTVVTKAGTTADETAESQLEFAADVQMDNVAKSSAETNSAGSSEEAASSFVQISPVSPRSSPEVFQSVDEQPEQLGAPVMPLNVPMVNIEEDPKFKHIQELLRQREDQLANKAEQLNELQCLMESQEKDFKQKLLDTKEEAKKRILRAKERFEAAEAKLKLISSSGFEDAAKKEEIIAALRSEGEALAMKQSAMEQAVRAAKAETRELRENLEDEMARKEKALEKIKTLEDDLKATKDALTAARKGESQVGKLENDLLAARSDAETKSNTILSLQQHIKELTSESKDLKAEIEKIQRAAAHEAQQEKTTMRREHNDLLTDLEAKLRTTEREAGVREDALRHEVAEIRKRWQDAVRRADALSMDIQSSTAPLLRQLESMERQSRARASNWAELENRLRTELEEAVIQNESLSKDRSDFKAKLTRLERMVKERDDELGNARKTIEEQITKIGKLETQIQKLLEEGEIRQIEYEKVERLASEGVARVRSEMSQTVIESEERYRGQIEKLETDLNAEREKRKQLESQVDHLLENSGMIAAGIQAREGMKCEAKPKRLRQAEGQAQILAGALGFDDSDDDSDDGFGDVGFSESGETNDVDTNTSRRGSVNSFAALEQLTSRLKTAQIELNSLRKSLRESEASRQSLVEELGETRHAKEKLPLFEAKVKALTDENREMELEIMGLREDIAEVKEMYRAQLNLLVEEKIAQENKHYGNSNDGHATKLPSDSGQESENPAEA